MPNIEKILNLIREFAPEQKTAPNYEDNVGLVVGSSKGETDKVLCCLDATVDTIEEAVAINAKLIVSHHPPIYYPIKKVVENDATGKKILRAVENGIALYAAHTNLDYASGGLNDYACEVIGLTDVVNLTDGIVGRIGELKEQTTLNEFAKKLKDVFDDQSMRIIPGNNRAIKRVAVINGGGGDLNYVMSAINMGADCLVTSDIKYHVALYSASLGLTLFEPTHYATEHIYIKRFVEIMNSRAKAAGVAVEFIVSCAEKSPYITI